MREANAGSFSLGVSRDISRPLHPPAYAMPTFYLRLRKKMSSTCVAAYVFLSLSLSLSAQLYPTLPFVLVARRPGGVPTISDDFTFASPEFLTASQRTSKATLPSELRVDYTISLRFIFSSLSDCKRDSSHLNAIVS
jgi:hypothetical protein